MSATKTAHFSMVSGVAHEHGHSTCTSLSLSLTHTHTQASVVSGGLYYLVSKEVHYDASWFLFNAGKKRSLKPFNAFPVF